MFLGPLLYEDTIVSVPSKGERDEKSRNIATLTFWLAFVVPAQFMVTVASPVHGLLTISYSFYLYIDNIVCYLIKIT